MATIDNSYTDLIHLFIDGEATEVERNTLFNALKDSPELQDEFHSAMELKKAFATDIMNLQPPSYLESQIAERAGILVAASAAAANAPVVVNAVSNALTNSAPLATGILSKGVITMIVGTSVGILSTIGIIKLTSNNNSEKIAPVAQQTITRQAEPIQTAPQSFATADQLSPMNIAPATIAEKHATPGQVKSEKVNQDMNIDQVGITDRYGFPAEVNTTQIPNNSQAIAEKQDNSPIVENAIAMVSSTTPLMPKLNAIGGESMRGIRQSEDMVDMSPSGIGRFSARLTGIMSSKLYQGQSNISTPIWNNIGAGVKYDLDASNAIGIEAGQEKFPLYLSNGRGGYDDHNSITWYGVSWTYSAVYLEVLGIHPELRILAAASNAGPIGKLSLGAVMPLTPRISFSVDGEETALPISSNGAYLIGNKLALTAALTFHF